MDPSHLQSFLKAYECGSVLKACALLNISQPALSRRLKRLEDVLQVRLFERTPTGLVPTAFGHALAARARLIGTEIELARREIERLRNAVGGWVSFGANPGVAGSLLPAVVRDLRRTNPELRLTVVEGVSDTLVGAVREGRLEFAVCTAPLGPGDTAMMFDHIAEDRFVIAADEAHPLAGGEAGADADADAVPLAETLRFPWAMATFTGFVRQWFESSFLSAGLTPPAPQVETSSMIFLKQLLRGDDYLSILPVRLIEKDFPGIARIRCRPDFLLTRSIAAARLRHRDLSPAAQLVVDTFKRLSA